MTKTCEICKNCKWWGKQDTDNSTIMYNPCKHPLMDDLAFANWGDKLEIGTREDFGCNQWEEKESNK